MPSFFDSAFASGARQALKGVFGESVLVQTVSDSKPRTIIASCSLDPDYGNISYALDGENETLAIDCDRDELTGIATAAIGKDKTRAWYGDDERPFIFSGEKRAVRPDRWTLIFKRKRPLRQGAVER